MTLKEIKGSGCNNATTIHKNFSLEKGNKHVFNLQKSI